MQVFHVAPDGSTEPIPKIHCTNEDRELQTLLEKRPDLLPGEQINPDDPRRWLLIKREMAVPCPSSGSDRWSIDFLMADQDAIPTFVEAKRHKDTRSRREVVAQMLDYAANGHYYWEKTDLRNLAEATAKEAQATLEQRLIALAPTGLEGVDAYFERMQENLREGQLRLVFFLEEAPMELKSLVDFLNRQMERTEVLLVEAQLFEQDGQRLVVPALFGYSEEARRAKRTVTVTSGGRRQQRPWDEDSFFEDLAERAGRDAVEAARKLYDFARAQGRPIKWGVGGEVGSFPALIIPTVSKTSLLTVWSYGDLALGFPDSNSDPSIRRLSARLHAIANSEWAFDLQGEYLRKNPRIKSDKWTPKVDSIIEGCKQLIAEFGAGD